MPYHGPSSRERDLKWITLRTGRFYESILDVATPERVCAVDRIEHSERVATLIIARYPSSYRRNGMF